MSGRARAQTQVGLTLKSMWFASVGSPGTPLAGANEKTKPARNKPTIAGGGQMERE